jgi:hypothetical protein
MLSSSSPSAAVAVAVAGAVAGAGYATGLLRAGTFFNVVIPPAFASASASASVQHTSIGAHHARQSVYV